MRHTWFSGEDQAIKTPTTGLTRGQVQRQLADEVTANAILRTLFQVPYTSVILAVYLVAAFLLPTTAPVAISDDWTYTRSVEYLVVHGDFHILPVAAATQITQLAWGGIFGLLFGVEFAVLRVSTLVVVFLSAIALRDMFRDLGVNDRRAAFGVGLYLFNPIMFSISYTFMSDPHFVAWMTIAIWLYVKAEVQQRPELVWWASALAAIACLQRPHGALIPLGVATWYLVSGRIRANRSLISSLAAIGLIPSLTVLLLYTVFSSGLPPQQGLFLTEARNAGADETMLLVKRLAVIQIAYNGFFVLPLAIGTAFAIVRAIGSLPPYATRLVFVAASCAAVGIGWFWSQGRLMPYVPHFFGRGGPGSGDLRYSREPLVGASVFEWLTIACGVAAIGALVLVIRSLGLPERIGRSGIGLLGCVLGWQAVGVLPQSFLFRNWIISLDRYLLPLLPLSIAIAVWAVNDAELTPFLAWPAIVAVALFSILGTRDVLVFHREVWGLARDLNAAGVANERLDAGYAWDAYHLWELGYEQKLEPRTPDGSWWTTAYAPATDSTYVISGSEIPGYQSLSAHEISSWLNKDPVFLFVLRRSNAPPDGIAWPPP